MSSTSLTTASVGGSAGCGGISSGGTSGFEGRAPSGSPLIGLCCQRSCSHRSEEHTSELQSLMRISYAVFCLKKKKNNTTNRQSVSKKLAQNTTCTQRD